MLTLFTKDSFVEDESPIMGQRLITSKRLARIIIILNPSLKNKEKFEIITIEDHWLKFKLKFRTTSMSIERLLKNK